MLWSMLNVQKGHCCHLFGILAVVLIFERQSNVHGDMCFRGCHRGGYNLEWRLENPHKFV